MAMLANFLKTIIRHQVLPTKMGFTVLPRGNGGKGTNGFWRIVNS